MKRHIANWANYGAVVGLTADDQPVYASNPVEEVFVKPSLTVPDMSLSLSVLLKRSRSGGSVTHYEGVYHGDDDLIPVNFEKMDKSERESYLRDVAAAAKSTRDVLQQRSADKAKKASKAAFDSAVAAAASKKLEDPGIEDPRI